MTAPGPSTANMEFQLRLIKAKDLAAKDITGKSDPFIKWTVDGKKKGKSKIVKQNLNPEWNETYFWDGCTERTVIKGEMWDHDLVGKDFMGCFQIDTADMMVAVMEPVERWIPLQKRSSSDKVSGEVLINIQFRQKPSANFDINAARALTAEISNQQNATPDANPYAPAPGAAPPTLPQHNSTLPPIPTSSHPPIPPSAPGGASAIPPSPYDQPAEPPVARAAPVAPGPPPPPPPPQTRPPGPPQLHHPPTQFVSQPPPETVPRSLPHIPAPPPPQTQPPGPPQLHHPPTQFVSQPPPETVPRSLPHIPAPAQQPPPSHPPAPSSQSHQDPHSRPLPSFGGPPQLPPSNPPSLPHSNPPSLPPSNPPAAHHHVPVVAPPMPPPEDTPPMPRRQPLPSLPPHPPAAPSAPSKPTLIATWDYQAANDTELSLSVGNRYTYDKEEDGWYQGTDVLSGKFGWFPGNYTKKEE